MKDDLRKFLNRETNVIRDVFTLGRESTSTSDYVILSHSDLIKPILDTWVPRNKTRKQVHVQIQEPTLEPAGLPIHIPKHTGGKEPYVMLMTNETCKLYGRISIEALGCFMMLSSCVEWHTGILKSGNGAMTTVDLQKYWNIGKLRTKRIIAELKKYQMLGYDLHKRSYILSRQFLKRGGANSAYKV